MVRSCGFAVVSRSTDDTGLMHGTQTLHDDGKGHLYITLNHPTGMCVFMLDSAAYLAEIWHNIDTTGLILMLPLTTYYALALACTSLATGITCPITPTATWVD